MKLSNAGRDVVKIGGVVIVAAAVTGAMGWLGYRNKHRTGKQRSQKRIALAAQHRLSPEERRPALGDILLFFRPNRTRDYLIEWITGSHFYHAALSDENGMVIEARPQGVIRNGLQGREGEFVVLRAPGGGTNGAAALNWAKTQIGDKFDQTDLLVIGLEHIFRIWKINYTRPGSYSCAELVATSYLRGADIQLAKDRELSGVAPGDLARLLPANRQSTI